MKPYGILSDQHCHNWSAFAHIDSNGVNSRLKIILDEMERAADEVVKAGGDTLFFAGDLNHERGSIKPSCANPQHEVIRRILEKLKIIAIPGNHDLASRDTTAIGNSILTLGALEGFTVLNKPTVVGDVLMIPFYESTDELRKHLQWFMDNGPATMPLTDVIIHAGIDGVLTGVPEHGLTADELAKYGFKRIFAGHYHNHKVMADGKVVSIGATAHHTWSDVGTNAGFLIVHKDRIDFRASHAPSFVEITADTDEEEIPLIVDGNYVRIRSMKLSEERIASFRKELEVMGAKGVMFQVAKEQTTARTGTTATGKTLTIDESVDSYIEKLSPTVDKADLKKECAGILTDVRSVSE